MSVATNTDEESEAKGRQQIGKPYKVAGRWYHPKEDEDYDKVGLASWYGAKFHGRSTANGEKFDRTALTAAHPTLPLPSFVRVTVVETGKSAVLRINDRGPFKRGRIIDVSRAAADELGFRRAGHAKVRVEYLGPAPIGGGDRETLVAARKYGTKSKSKLIVDDKSNKSREKSRDIEVRLASAEPLTGKEEMPPGVSSRYAPRRSAGAKPAPTSLAYAAEAESNGAIDAVIAMNDAEEPKEIAAQPLPETATHVTTDRFAGAHDLFASGSDSGISQAVAEPAAATTTTAAATTAAQ